MRRSGAGRLFDFCIRDAVSRFIIIFRPFLFLFICGGVFYSVYYSMKRQPVLIRKSGKFY